MQHIIKSNRRFELFEIRADTNVYCTVCQIIIKEDNNYDGLLEHYISLKHIDNLTNKILTAKQADQTLSEKKSFSFESELFNYTKAQKKMKQSQENLKSYFNQCIMNHPKILDGLEPQSAKAYIRELKNFYLYLFEKKHMSTVNSEIIIEYIEANNYTHKQSAVMRLFKAFNIPLKYQIKQKVQQLIEKRKIKKISYNNFELLQDKLIQQLEDKKYYKEALALLLSKQGMPPEEIHQIQVKNISKVDNEAILLIQKILQDNPESYLFDNKKNFTQQTKEFLYFRKQFLKSYPQDEEFQRFIRNASLRSIYELNKQTKQIKEDKQDSASDLQIQIFEKDESKDKDDNLFDDLSLQNESINNQQNKEITEQFSKKKKIIGIKKSVKIDMKNKNQVGEYTNANQEEQCINIQIDQL